jgi:hypothetical protein
LVPAVAVAGDLTWQEMANRPELWPAQVTVNVAMDFQGGVGVRAGQKANVVGVKAAEIDLATTDGKLNFAADPDETDALAVAREAYAKLTPKQRELTYPSLAQHKELWPARLTLTRSFQVGGGQSVNVGDQVVVKDVQLDRVLVWVERLNTTFQFALPATDIMAQARKFVEEPQAGPRFVAEQKQIAGQKPVAEAKRPVQDRVIGELNGKLVNSVTGKIDPLDANALPKYLVFMRGSSTCPITRKFAPTLVKYYNDMKPKHPEFEIVWIMTESPEDTGKYAKATGFAWRAIEYESTGTMPTVNQPITGKLPQLIVMDRNGNILANGSQNQAPAALAKLDALLNQPKE